MKISDFCEAAHTNALKHGFYDTHDAVIIAITDLTLARFTDHAFELASIARMHSELAEATDTKREDKSAKIPAFRHSTEEMADLLIRIADHCGRWGYDLGAQYNEQCGFIYLFGALEESIPGSSESLPQLIAECHYHLGCATEKLRHGASAVHAFAAIFFAVNTYYLRFSDDDLVGAILAKMEYNESRPYKHGRVS
jgi:hypothetical protein